MLLFKFCLFLGVAILCLSALGSKFANVFSSSSSIFCRLVYFEYDDDDEDDYNTIVYLRRLVLSAATCTLLSLVLRKQG